MDNWGIAIVSDTLMCLSKLWKRQIPTKIPGVAQGCHLGNQAGFVLGPHIHRSMKVQKNFIVLDISRFTIWLLDYREPCNNAHCVVWSLWYRGHRALLIVMLQTCSIWGCLSARHQTIHISVTGCLPMCSPCYILCEYNNYDTTSSSNSVALFTDLEARMPIVKTS